MQNVCSHNGHNAGTTSGGIKNGGGRLSKKVASHLQTICHDIRPRCNEVDGNDDAAIFRWDGDGSESGHGGKRRGGDGGEGDGGKDGQDAMRSTRRCQDAVLCNK